MHNIPPRHKHLRCLVIMFIVSELQNYISHTNHCLYFCYKVIFSFLSQDQINMSASTDLYKKIALECSSQQIAMDLFVCVPHNKWTWLPSVSSLTGLSHPPPPLTKSSVSAPLTQSSFLPTPLDKPRPTGIAPLPTGMPTSIAPPSVLFEERLK